MPKVFISHSSRDKALAVRLAGDLTKAGVDIWYDQWEIKVGDSIIDKINNGLRVSDYLLIILSKASANSQWVKEELSAAKTIEIDKRGVFILPALAESCDIPPLIVSKRYADFRSDYQYGLDELLDVLGRTSARKSDAERYRDLEASWSRAANLVEQSINHLTEAEPRAEGLYLVNPLPDSFDHIRKQINDALDIYCALRPLEKSKHLASMLDGGAKFLAILGSRFDMQVRSLQAAFSPAEPASVDVLLGIGCAQAACGLAAEATWTFRKAVRLGMALNKDVELSLLALTYHLSRRISYLIFAGSIRHDLVVELLAYEHRETEQRRCGATLECFRSALEREMGWHLDRDPIDCVYYAELMQEAGFWREATRCIDKILDKLPAAHDIHKRKEEMKRVLDTLDAKQDCHIQAQIHQIPTIMCEFGQRNNYDELIKEANPDFWRDIIEQFEGTDSDGLFQELFPQENVI